MKDLAELDIRASAKVVAGVTTNRVKMRTPRRPRVKATRAPKRLGRPPKPTPPPKPARAPRKAKPIRSAFGGESNVVQVCVSVDPAELAVFDAAAAKLGMSRSRFLRTGAHVLIATHAALMSKPP